MKKVLVTPKSFGLYKEQAFALLHEHGYEPIENKLGRTLTVEEILELAGEEAVGIIVGIDPLPGHALTQFKQLKAISKYGMGMDNIDLIKAKELGIQVMNAAGTNHISVAELAITLMLTMARNITSVAAKVKAGRWERSIGYELTGKKLGLIGGGQIGREVAKRAGGLQMEVSIYDPFWQDAAFAEQYKIQIISDLDTIYKESDIISLHVPYLPETKGMIDQRALRLMKPSAMLINTSRGELVNEEDLYEALANNQIYGAAQDVFSSEPPEADNKLIKLDNFILTSHIGAFTHESVERMVLYSTRNLLEMLNGIK
jgi:phosphoglycerate dehydrogenase-like enzyme